MYEYCYDFRFILHCTVSYANEMKQSHFLGNIGVDGRGQAFSVWKFKILSKERKQWEVNTSHTNNQA